MCTMWPIAVLVALGHVRATLTLPTAKAPDYSVCHQCSNGGHRDEVQRRLPRTLIQVQRQQGFHLERVEETQARSENKRNVAELHLEGDRMAPGLQARAKVEQRHSESIAIRPHVETNSTSIGLNITPKSHQQYGHTAQAGTNSTSAGLNITPRSHQQYGHTAQIGTNSTSAGLNITPKSHQQYGTTAKAGIGAVQWQQMMYVSSRRKIEAMINGSSGEMFILVLKCLLGFLLLVCLPLMVLAAYLCDMEFSMDTYRFCRRGQQGPSPQVALFSSADNHRGSPRDKCATPISGSCVPSSSFPRQRKQDQQQQKQRQEQQHRQQQEYLAFLPLQSREQSRQHKASPPASPEEDLSNGPCICPELLVPPGKECCLMLPRVITTDIHPPGRFTIVSPDGATVFSLTLGNSWHTASHGKRLLTLHSPVTEGTVFASCDAVVSDQGEPEKLVINGRDGEHFADIQPCGADKSAMLAPLSGPSATIRYEDQQTGRILIQDSNGGLLAVAEAINDSVQAVRIGAKVDAALISITMLSFNLLH